MAEWHQFSPVLARHLAGALSWQKETEAALFDREGEACGFRPGALLVLCPERPVKLYQVRKALESAPVPPPAAMLWLEEPRELVLLLQGEQPDTPALIDKALREALPRVRFFLGVSRPVTPGPLLSRYEGARRAAGRSFYEPERRIFPETETPEEVKRDPGGLRQSEKKLAGGILSGVPEEECRTLTAEYMDQLRRLCLPPETAIDTVRMFFQAMERVLRYVDPLCALPPDWPRLQELSACRTLRALGEETERLVLELGRCGEPCLAQVDTSIRRVMEYLQSHLDEIPSLDVIAREFHINKFVFCRQFKRQTGQTFGEHIKSVRLREAARLLRETDLRVYEIAERIGYQDVGSFSSFFKRCTGKSPREYRRQED